MESFEALEIYQKIIYGNLDNGEFFYLKSTVDAEIAQLMAIAYPDGPQADAAVPMSRYEPLLKSERELRDRLVILEAEVDRLKTAIKTFSDKWQYYDSKTIAGLDELRQALSGGR